MPSFSFDFANICEQIGVQEDQVIQNLNSYMKSAQQLIKKYPNKKLVVDLQFAKLHIDDSKPPSQSEKQIEVDYVPAKPVSHQARSVRSLTRDNLKSEFGSFKRNPGQPLSHRSSVINQFDKMYKNNKILGLLNKKVQLN